MNKELELLIKHRRVLHQIPEVGMEEYLTSDYIYNVVKDYNCEITRVHTGIILYFDRGRKDTIAYRSDIDALPVTEVNDIPYKSKREGFMHACGHDGHMAMMLALSKYVNEHKDLKYNILIIFQPCEERIGGAPMIIESGIFKRHPVKAIFASHIWPNMEKGKVYTKYGEMMAEAREVNIEIIGKSAHVAKYQEGADSILASARFICHMDEYLNSLNDEKIKLLKFGYLHSGTIRNVIANKAIMYASLRTYDSKLSDDIVQEMINYGKVLENELKVKVNININPNYCIALINDRELVSIVHKGIKDIILLDEPSLLAEDFSEYSKVTREVFFYVGDSGNVALHSNNFNFDEEILISGYNNYIKLLDLDY